MVEFSGKQLSSVSAASVWIKRHGSSFDKEDVQSVDVGKVFDTADMKCDAAVEFGGGSKVELQLLFSPHAATWGEAAKPEEDFFDVALGCVVAQLRCFAPTPFWGLFALLCIIEMVMSSITFVRFFVTPDQASIVYPISSIGSSFFFLSVSIFLDPARFIYEYFRLDDLGFAFFMNCVAASLATFTLNGVALGWTTVNVVIYILRIFV